MGYTSGRIYQRGDRFFVQLYWNGKSEQFWSVLIAGKWCAIKSRANAEKLLCAIQEDIDRDREGFDPRSFRKGNPLCLGTYYQTWLDQIDVVKTTKRDYRTAITKHAIPFFGADKDIKKLRMKDLMAFQKSLRLSDKSKFNIMSSLKTMVRWAYLTEEIKHVPPFPKITMGENPEIEYLTLDQQAQILARISKEDAPISLLGWSSASV